MNNTFFTADLHLGHTAIIKRCQRPFSSVEEMEEAMVSNWNRVVTSNNDIVYVLGDVALYSTAVETDPIKVFGRLRGRKCLIVGNHDCAKTFLFGWEWVKRTHFVKGLIHEGIWLSHFPSRPHWLRSVLGSWHLFGHRHGNLSPKGASFDIGVDCWDFTPVEFEVVREKMENLLFKVKKLS
jgi:calcineurin-like phosphoesterase family protein